ncbi:GGDEF domain-containing protein [Candidatus Saccharibacteria bacterium]|nr:GGDEF domain-containing protein [Candidatus Saccharibacteria bacterium]
MVLARRKTDPKFVVKSLLKSFIYLGVDEASHRKTRDLVAAENYNNSLFLCEVAGFVLMMLSMVSLVPGLDLYLGKYRQIFIVFAVAFVMLAGMFQFSVKEHNPALLPMSYLASGLLLALAIIIGPVMDDETLSMTFFIVLFVIALLLVDVPVRIGLLFVSAGVAFCIAVVINKEGMMRVYDLINCAVFLPVSLVLETMVEKRKFMQFQLQRKIEGERDTDGLTTLLTRDAGQRMIEVLLRDGAIKRASLVMMDLDNFKDINDTYGHPAGDVVLGAVGDMLEHSFRDTDVLVRFGGDEFMLLLPDISEKEEVKVCMEKIRTRLATMATIPGYKQTASFGVAFFPEHGKTFEELLAQADKALYAAKYSGKDASCIYQEK